MRHKRKHPPAGNAGDTKTHWPESILAGTIQHNKKAHKKPAGQAIRQDRPQSAEREIK
jgi:hypothetical protein